MEEIRQYVISITAAAIICGILLALLSKSHCLPVAKILCGIFMTLIALSPIHNINVNQIISEFDLQHIAKGHSMVSAGEDLAKDALSDIIIAETEAYILDKAESLGVSAQVKVFLNDGSPPVPDSAIIRGTVSPYVKQNLMDMIVSDLGIAKENQRWVE